MEKMIIGNFKMNLTKDEILSYINQIKEKDIYQKAIYCPSNLYLPYFIKENIKVGIQNISVHKRGAYTGEISAMQAQSIGVEYAIIGHSERRNHFHETEEQIHEKVKNALENNLKVILCIGECEVEREVKNEILKKQIIEVLKGVEKKDIIIAYEPVWAIGSGNAMKEEEMKETISYIKNLIFSLYQTDIKVLYGGSVNEENIESLSQIEEVDGFLVGGASIKPEVFFKVIEVAVTM